MAESTAKMRQEILALSGVDIMLDSKNFKSTYQIMDELANKWEDLSDIAQASIIELMAGKHQGNVFASLMQNFDVAREALETSLNSSGSALAEHAKWSESLEARLNKLKAAWQSLSQAFMNSSSLKVALDAVIGLVDGLTKLIDTFGTLPTIFGSIGLIKGIGAIAKAKDALQLVGGVRRLADVMNILSHAFPNAAEGIGIFTSALKSGTGIVGVLKGALKGLWTVIAAHPIIATIAVVGAAIAIFNHFHESASELAEKVDELTSKYKEQSESLKKLKSDYDTSKESSMISKYEKLSKGVDNLGRNVSLTSEEYSEYQSIVNSIAEQFPSLISGYDEQGNALLTCKGNVEALTEAYEKLVHAQNQEILTNTKDIEKNFKNLSSDKSDISFWERTGHYTPIVRWFMEDELTTDIVKRIENSFNNPSELDGYWDELDKDAVKEALKDAGISIGFSDDPIKVLKETMKTDPAKVKGIIDDYYGQFAEVVEQQKTIAQATLSEAFDISSVISGLNYGNIGEDLQGVARQVVNSLDYDFFAGLQEQGKTVEQWTKEMLNQLNAIGKADNAQIEAAFDLQTQFNGGEISYGEYVGKMKEVGATIEGLGLDAEVEKQLKISLGLDENGVIDQYNTLINRLTDSKNYDFDISENEAKKLLNGLSSEELAIAVDVITQMSNNGVKETIDQIQNAIDRELAIQGLTLELSIDVEKTKLESLTTAITESFSGSGLSSESLSAIEGMFSGLSSYDSSKLFERTANGIRLNSGELRRLNSEYKKTNIVKLNSEMDSLGDIYNQTREELYGLTYGTDEYNAKAAELSGIEERIKATEQLAAQYEGLASSYQEWQMVESAGSQRDMYEGIIAGFENIDDEISRGWYDDGTIEFLELLSGKDLSTAGIEEVKKAYKGLGKEIEHTSYSVRDFFTVDDEGNSTNAGVYNFLDAIGQMEEEKFGGKDVVQRKDGKIVGFNFDLVGGDEVIAEALGVSEELVQIMVRAADDAGFVVSMDGTYQQLDVLKEKAQEASVVLNNILEKNGKEGFDFNFNTSNVDDITNQLGEAQKILDTFRNSDGTINTKLEGADEALTVASTLQSMLDKLTRPIYMDIEVSQVEDEIQEPLKHLQELRRLTETEHQLKLSGADTSELEKSKQEVYEYFEGLDPEVKATLGLVDENDNPLTGKALQDKLNSGDIAIEATVDIQMKMDDKLGILVDKALLDAGIIDDEEFKKRVDIYLDATVDNTDAKSKTDNAVDEVADSNGSGTTTKDGSGGKVEKNVDVEVKADEVDTSDVKNKTEEAVEKEGNETFAIETKVELETTIDEALDLIDRLEDKNITIDVTVKGLDDVKELSKNLDLDSKVKGNTDKLVKYAESAKILSELDDNIASFVTAEIKGNVIDKEEKHLKRLKTFADGAKILQDANTKTVKITANVWGNAIETSEDSLARLEAYSAISNEIKDGEIVSSVTANVDGNAITTEEYKINNLKVFSDSVKDIKNTGHVTHNVTANVWGNVIETPEDSLDRLKAYSTISNEIKDGEITSSIDANVDGNVIDTEEYKINNLKVFSDSVKDIKNTGNVTHNVTANVWGNVTTTPEDSLARLEAYSAISNEIKDGEIVSSVTANVDGNAITTEEYKINNLKVFSDSVKDIKNTGNVTHNVTANVWGNVTTTPEDSLDRLKTYSAISNEIKNEEIKSSIDANVAGNVIDTKEYKINNLKVFSDSVKDIENTGHVTHNVTANVWGNVIGTPEESLARLEAYADSSATIKEGDITSSITADADGNIITGEDASSRLSSLTEFKSLIDGMSSQNVTVSVSANVDSENVDKAIQLLKDVSNSGVFKDYKATVQVGATIATIDDTVVQNYIATEKIANGKVNWSNDESLVNQFKQKVHEATGQVKWDDNTDNLKKSFTATGTVNWTSGNNVKVKVVSNASGTAHADGSASGRAFARGDWGIKGNGVALGGELGRELIVRDGKFFTIGDAGAEFFRYKKNDIVFNAAQTESLFKYGGIKGANPRGKMLASGTAFTEGNAFGASSGYGGSGSAGGNSVTGESYGSKDSSSSSSADKDFEEVIDWIEVVIDRVERAIDKFDQQANNIYKSWSSRNKALQNQISKVNKEIGIQQKAYTKYMSAANGVGLSSSWAEKVRNGEIDIDTIKDEALAEKIKSYQDYYEKALDCKDAIEELKETEAELYAQRVENVSTQYEGILGVIEHEKNMLEEYISQSEANAQLISANYYNALASNEKENIAQLKKEKAAMLAELQTAMESGTIIKGSEAWYEMVASVDEVTVAIAEGETQLKEYSQTLQQLSWERFDLLQEKISAVTEETEFLIDLMSSDKLFDDNGKLTESGSATMGLHGVAYNANMYQADLVAKEAERLKKQLAKDPLDTELEERYREMISLQQEYILAAQDEKEAIRDLVSNGIELELDALQELIDKHNEALDSQKDLYDYQKQVQEQAEEIASLEKQRAAYLGNDSEEGKAKLQEIEVSLKEAKADLEETEYDRYISDQQQLLDELYLEYETILNTRIDDIDALLSDMIAQINSDATSISSTLSEKADSVGYTLSDSMKTIWTESSNGTNSVITTYGEKFTSAQTTTNNALNVINTNLQNMITQLNKLAKTNVKSASTSSAANSKQASATKKTSTTTKKTNNTTANTSKSVTVGGMVNASGAKIYDYAGDTSGERQLYRNDPKYKVLKEKGNWIQVRWHKLSSGITGWFKKGDVKAYATGKQNFLDDEVAWTQENGQEYIVRPSDGAILTPIAKGDSVLNADASSNIWNMANAPSEFIRDNLGISAANVPNNSTVQSNYTQHLDKVVFSFPNVKSYDEMLAAMQKDKNFERLISAMTIDRIAGKSNLAKGKSIR